MSINHFSSDLPDTLWWTPQQQQTPIMEPPPQNPLISQLYHHHHQPLTAARGTNTPFDFNLNQEDDEEQFDDQQPKERENEDYEQKNMESGEELIIQKEAMFEKPLTPSDVGKLNRLVIPKQHAEKYFPIGGNGGGDSVEKGLLLSFEDETGKSWRFRYSYWNSSQSYVLTKGWSRFVKEKRLDAGDVVMFKRYRNDGERFFIGWRRRNAVAQLQDSVVAQPPAVVPIGGGWSRVFYSGHPYPTTPSQLQYPNGPPLPYQPDCLHAAAGGSSAAAGMENQTTPSGNSKTVRLFGVNLECQSDEPLPIPAGGSSQGQAHYHHNYSNTAHHSNHHTHMDINFSGDVNRMRFHQG